jgi:hypothetical protein
MNRADFEQLRNIPGKIIAGDIRLMAKRPTHPLLIADDIEIENALGVETRMIVQYNPEVGSKTINVVVANVGPVCRLDVDGPAHEPCGRSHKHSLQTERCPDRNLPEGVRDLPQLLGSSLQDVFNWFCAEAQITHQGQIIVQEEVTQ